MSYNKEVFSAHSWFINKYHAWLLDYMDFSSKVSCDCECQVAIFLWLVDERHNLGLPRQQLQKLQFHIRLECESCPGKKLSNFLSGLITKRIPFHWWGSCCSFLKTIVENDQIKHIQHASVWTVVVWRGYIMWNLNIHSLSETTSKLMETKNQGF